MSGVGGITSVIQPGEMIVTAARMAENVRTTIYPKDAMDVAEAATDPKAVIPNNADSVARVRLPEPIGNGLSGSFHLYA